MSEQPADLNSTSAPIGTAEPTLGEYLRQQREARGISIEQLASATKINVRILQSLEDDQYRELPAKPFVRGFVTSYARFIGLDPKGLLLRYDSFLSEKSLDRPARDAGHSGYAFDRKDSEQSRIVLWVVMGSFMVIGGILWVFLKPALQHRRSAHVEKLQKAQSDLKTDSLGSSQTTEPQVASGFPVMDTVPSAVPVPSTSPRVDSKVAEVPVLTPSSTPSPVASTQVQAVSPPSMQQRGEPPLSEDDPLASGVKLKSDEIRYKVILKALADVVVRYRSDDRTKMQFVLRKDRVLVLRGSQMLAIQVSNAKAVSARINGSPAKPMSDWKASDSKAGSRFLFGSSEGMQRLDPFEGESPLFKTADPVPDNAPNQ